MFGPWSFRSRKGPLNQSGAFASRSNADLPRRGAHKKYYVERRSKLRAASHFPLFSVRFPPSPQQIPPGKAELMTRIVLTSLVGLFLTTASFALSPNEIILIVNRNVPESAEVAAHYRRLRHVPAENVVTLDLPTTEDISRRDYNSRLIAPLRAALKTRKDQIKVLLCIYGVPLRVGGIEPKEADRIEIAKLDEQLKSAREQVKTLQARLKLKESPTDKEELAATEKRVQSLQNRRNRLARTESNAAVDNELMLLWWDDYELYRFLVNPLHFQVNDEYRRSKPPVMMTARLDGPTAEIAKRLVSGAVEVEKTGLSGTVYVDARDNRYDPMRDSGYGYGGYDESMREMAALLRDEARMNVVLDNKSAVFKEGACPNCALYCGWYSHAKFIDSCGLVKGAVAWHLASSEAVSLRRKNSTLWCPNLLTKGACATLGPVAEPYTIGFPKPAEFFGFLVTGEYTLVECYARTLNLTSWMCTLIGDPLYNPFKAAPRLRVDQVFPSPKGGRFLLKTRD